MEKTLAEGSDLSLVRARTPIEAAITEGNLAELPIFVLSNKAARPYVIDEQTGKKAFLEEDYKRTIELPNYESEQGVLERSIKIDAHQSYGFPTMFAYRVLIVVLDRCKQDGCVSAMVEITRYEIARALGYETPGAREYQDIANALNAMRTLNLELRGTWYERAKGQRAERIKCTGLITDFDFQDGRAGQRSFAFAEPFDVGLKQPTNEPRSPNFVQLSTLLFDSLQQRYLVGVDLRYLNVLPTPVAQKLYVYLTKKNAGRRTYSEAVRNLGAKLDIKKRSPADILKTVTPALSALAEPLPVTPQNTPRRFLETWRVLDKNRVVEVQFFEP